MKLIFPFLLICCLFQLCCERKSVSTNNLTKKIRVEASKQDSPALLNDTIPVYTIKRGETLWDLATAFYGNRHYSNLLAKYNGIQDVTSIKAGILIKVPDLRTMLKDPKMGLFPIIGKEIENIFGSTLLIHEK